VVQGSKHEHMNQIHASEALQQQGSKHEHMNQIHASEAFIRTPHLIKHKLKHVNFGRCAICLN